jgi:steroid delta-isomerase-like uncharacterized protein
VSGRRLADEGHGGLGLLAVPAQPGGQLGVVDELVDSAFVNHNTQEGLAPDRDGYRQYMAEVRASFPDVELAIEDFIAEADKVAVRYAGQGSHLGAMMGAPPTGKRVTFSGINVFRLAGGRVVERWVMHDSLGVLQQLGLFPAPQQATC